MFFNNGEIQNHIVTIFAGVWSWEATLRYDRMFWLQSWRLLLLPADQARDGRTERLNSLCQRQAIKRNNIFRLLYILLDPLNWAFPVCVCCKSMTRHKIETIVRISWRHHLSRPSCSPEHYYWLELATNFAKISQSHSRPLLWPSPVWKDLVALLHWRH